MKINLPDIEIQPDWTIPSQVKKIGEEYGEVAEAVALDDPVRIIKKALKNTDKSSNRTTATTTTGLNT